MSEQGNQTNPPTALFSRSRQNKIRPISAGTSESLHVEIRPNRFLRIQHINARPRDPKFEKEMQMQMLYKKQGITTVAGPLSMPKKKPVREASTLNNAQSSGTLPNSIDHNSKDNQGIREISASGTKGHFTSPSNVHVDMENSANNKASDPSHTAIQEEKHNPVQNCVSDTDKQNQAEISDKGPNNSTEDASEKRPKSDHNPPASSSVQPTSQANTPRHQAASQTNTPRDQAASQLNTPRHQTEQTAAQASTSISDGPQSPRIPSAVLFFFHGVGGSSDVWQAQIRYFAKQGYEIIAPDMIGHGMSCTPKDAKSYHFQEITADMEEIFDKFCKKTNILIGHSYGCSFAVLLARRRSRRVQKLVLISGGGPTPLAPQPGIFSLPQCMLRCVRPCLNHGFQRSAFHKANNTVVDKEDAFSIPTYVLRHTMNGQDWPDGDEIYHQWLLCSTLLIYGARDRLVTLEEEKQMEEAIFRSRLEVIPDASHMVMIETPDEVNRLLLGFFSEGSAITTKNSSPQPPSNPIPLDRSVSRMSMKSTKSHKAMPSQLM